MAQITLADGTRPFVELDPTIAKDDIEAARVCAKIVSERARDLGSVGRQVKETVAEYAKRWCAWREGRGLGCVYDDRALLSCHVLPTMGAINVYAIEHDDLRRLVNALDSAARRGWTGHGNEKRKFGWKTAMNAWSVVRAMFRDACGGKDEAIRVLDANPTDGVAGPDVGVRKSKQYLWPSEFMALVSCERVPLRWRQLVALAVYTYARAGELAALEWSDVDLEHATIHVHRSLDTKRGQGLKSTKSAVARRVPIEPALLPILKTMKETAKTPRVIEVPKGHLARPLRVYLKTAGIARAELFLTDATRKAVTFHDLRATGVTWCAVRGDDALKIKQRAGHASFSTTEGYIREAENLRGGFGEVFPALPAELVGSARSFATVSQNCETDPKSSQKQAEFCGGAGNRTRVRKRIAPASTYVSGSLNRSRARLPAGFPVS